MATSTTLRILCLHDRHSSAPDLKEQLEPLGQKLFDQHGIDLVYVNSPIVTLRMQRTGDDGKEPTADKHYDDNPPREQRVWWEEVRRLEPRADTAHQEEVTADAPPFSNQGAEDEKSTSNGIHYRGLDASLMLVRQIWSSCPFWGILGVGQGAAVASILLSLLCEDDNINLTNAEEEGSKVVAEGEQEEPEHPLRPTMVRRQAPPQFAIFVAGESLVPVDEPILDTTDLPILHLVNNNNSNSNGSKALQQQQERLIRQLGGRVEHRATTSSSSRVELDRHDWNILGRFVVEQKKRLFSGDGGGIASSSSGNTTSSQQEIVALQTALHLAEQQAADVVAETIASNPPAALMAVIRPQQVAGWNGNKRREFGAEGGGAPCPSEFLLHQNQRQTTTKKDAGGPSRVHPSNRQTDESSDEAPATM